jgi:hypothetical protein
MNSQACHQTVVNGNNGNMMQTPKDTHDIEPEINQRHKDISKGAVIG